MTRSVLWCLRRNASRMSVSRVSGVDFWCTPEHLTESELGLRPEREREREPMTCGPMCLSVRLSVGHTISPHCCSLQKVSKLSLLLRNTHVVINNVCTFTVRELLPLLTPLNKQVSCIALCSRLSPQSRISLSYVSVCMCLSVCLSLSHTHTSFDFHPPTLMCLCE